MDQRVRFPFNVPGVLGYRSISKEFAKELTQLRCHHKDAHDHQCTATFSQNNLPAIAFCGHLACRTHWRDDAALDVANVPDFQCMENHDPGTSKGYFLRDQLLDDFFTVIAQGGVECDSCKEHHPQFNSVQYRVANTTPVGPPTFLCVWCAATEAAFKLHYMELIPNDVYGRYETGIAQSVNRDQNDAGWAMYMCCICEGDMFTDWNIDTTVVFPVAFLSCGHLCEYRCFKNKSDLKCKICNTGNRVKNLKEIDPMNLGYPRVGELIRCQGVCKQKHPIANCVVIDPHSRKERLFNLLKGPTYWCVWCVVEKMMFDRRNW